MQEWNEIRQKLEEHYLTESLRGHLTYFRTIRDKTPLAGEEVVGIRVDGADLLKSDFAERFPQVWKRFADMQILRPTIGKYEIFQISAALAGQEGCFLMSDFCNAFKIYEFLSVDEALCSDDAIIMMFSLLDHRFKRQRLEQLFPHILMDHAPWMQAVYLLRLEAEGILPSNGVNK